MFIQADPDELVLQQSGRDGNDIASFFPDSSPGDHAGRRTRWASFRVALSCRGNPEQFRASNHPVVQRFLLEL